MERRPEKDTPSLIGNAPAPSAPLIPTPTAEYLLRSNPTLNRELSNPQPILIILDLNGALLARSKQISAYQASKCPFPRPYLDNFLNYLFQNFGVMVWSSAQPDNVRAMVDAIFSPKQKQELLEIWARDTLGLTAAQTKQKVVVYKNLERVWSKIPYTHGGSLGGDGPGAWNQTNTILFDDSKVKAMNQPYNHVEVSAWENLKGQEDDVALVRAMAYLERVRWMSNVSAFMRQNPFLLG